MCDRREVSRQQYANAQCFNVKRVCNDLLDCRHPVFGVQRAQTKCPLIIETLTGTTDSEGNLIGSLVKGDKRLCLDCGESIHFRGENGVSVSVKDGSVTFSLED